jgi:Domain of unknown function (DUF4351)
MVDGASLETISDSASRRYTNDNLLKPFIADGATSMLVLILLFSDSIQLRGQPELLVPFKTGIIVLHQLPVTNDTLWLRILGRDNVQIRAIAEIAGLPIDSPYRQNALELFSNLKIILESKQNKNAEETELIMNLSPLYLEQIDIATQKGRAMGEATGIAIGEATGIATGVERGRVEEGRSLIIRQLTRKLGELNAEMIDLINSLALAQIESLGDALLDFDRIEDLIAWLSENRL